MIHIVWDIMMIMDLAIMLRLRLRNASPTISEYLQEYVCWISQHLYQIKGICLVQDHLDSLSAQDSISRPNQVFPNGRMLYTLFIAIAIYKRKDAKTQSFLLESLNLCVFAFKFRGCL